MSLLQAFKSGAAFGKLIVNHVVTSSWINVLFASILFFASIAAGVKSTFGVG